MIKRNSHVAEFLETIDDLIARLLLRQEMILEAAGATEPEIRQAINASRAELNQWALRSTAQAEEAIKASTKANAIITDMEPIQEDRILCEDGKTTLVYMYRGEELIGTRHDEARPDDRPA